MIRMVCALLVALLAMACSNEPPPPEPVATDIPEELLRDRPVVPSREAVSAGTPLEERVATIGLLNKRNNLTQDLEMRPGESRRVGDVIVRLASCERTAPWETPPETGAFVQVLTRNTQVAADDDAAWQRIFSGWLFKNSPSLNVVEHPIYDVWVKDCAMSFPGAEADSEAAAATDETA